MPELITADNSMKADEPLRFAVWVEDDELQTRAPLEENPDSYQQWCVSFDVLYGDWISGSDKGVVWFDNQNFYLVGTRTSFAIPGHRIDNEVLCRMDIVRPLQRKFRIPISSGSSLPLSIQVDLIPSPPFVPENLAFLEALRNCKSGSDLTCEGQLPPSIPHGSAMRLSTIKALLVGTLLKVLILTVVSLGLVTLLLEDLRLTPLVGLVIFAALMYQLKLWFWSKLAAAWDAMRSRAAYYQKHSADSR